MSSEKRKSPTPNALRANAQANSVLIRFTRQAAGRKERPAPSTRVFVCADTLELIAPSI